MSLAQLSTTVEIGGAIDVVPNVRGVHKAELQFIAHDAIFGEKVQQKGEGTEFEALREYRPGLDTRFIDWKHSARHRKMLCKEFRTERNHPVVLAFDTGHLMIEPLGGVPRLDHAINAALRLAWLALRSGDLVGVYGFDTRIRHYTHPTRGTQNFSRVQRATAQLEYRPEETNFTLGLAELNARLKRRALVILFTDFVDTTTAELLIESMQRIANRHVAVFVTLRDSYLRDTVDKSPRSLRRCGPGRDRTGLPARPQRRLRTAGADRRAMSRRAERLVARRADQPVSANQAARADLMDHDGWHDGGERPRTSSTPRSSCAPASFA